MSRHPQAMHVARIRSGHVDKQGRHRDYESRYLRRTYRDGGKVKHETLANLSALPDEVVDGIEAALKGARLVAADVAITITRSLPHDNPVAPARRSATAQAKASHQHDEFGNPYRSFHGLLEHLATLTRNQIHFAGTTTELPMLANPTPDQRRAFDLINAPIPLTLQ